MTPQEVPELIDKTTAALKAAGFNPSGGPAGFIVSGRLPIWAATALVHAHGHARPWAGVFDPRLAGGVVVMSHDPTRRVGEVVPIEGATARVEVTF